MPGRSAMRRRLACWQRWHSLELLLPRYYIASSNSVTQHSQKINCRSLGELAYCKTLASKTKRDMQPFEHRSVRYWSKEINGTHTGGAKKEIY